MHGDPGRAEQLEQVVGVVEMLADDDVRGAEVPDGHLAGHDLPGMQHGIDADDVVAVGAVEFEGFEVEKHELTLRVLVEEVLDHLGTVLGLPPIHYLRQGRDRHSTFPLLMHEVRVRGCDDHELEL